jgi:hypothetical protein
MESEMQPLPQYGGEVMLPQYGGEVSVGGEVMLLVSVGGEVMLLSPPAQTVCPPMLNLPGLLSRTFHPPASGDLLSRPPLYQRIWNRCCHYLFD